MNDASKQPAARSGFRVDKNISVGTIVTILVIMAAAFTGYVQVQAIAQSNQKEIGEIEARLSADHDFHVRHRERLWSRVNEVQGDVNQTAAHLATQTAKTEYIAKQVDRLVDRLIEGKARQ